MIRSAFPDFHLTIEDQIAEGDKVVTRCTAGGTYKGGLEDIPSTAAIAKQVTVTEILIHRIAGGKMAEGWIEFDQLGLWQQLGVIPWTGEGRYYRLRPVIQIPPVSRLGFPVNSHIWLSKVPGRSVWGIGQSPRIATKAAQQAAGANRASCAAKGGRPVIFA